MLDITNKLIEGIKEYFKNTNGKVAVIGISGGKDSSVAAALCVKALGRENVLGVLMPCGEQSDIEDSYKLCEFLDIEHITINISDAYNSIKNIIKYQANHTMKYDNISELFIFIIGLEVFLFFVFSLFMSILLSFSLE